MLSTFFQLTVSGVVMGMLYALMALGLVLLIRSVGTMNFAQGDFLASGAYIGYWLSVTLSMSKPMTIASNAVILVIFGVLFMFTVYWPVRNSSWPQAIIMCTIGASTVISEAVKLIWGPLPLAVEPLIKGSTKIFGAYIDNQYFVILAVTVFFIATIFLLYEKLYCGRVMQAAAQDKYVATLTGIPTILTTAITFAVVLIIVGMGGFLVAPIMLASTNLSRLQLRAFAGVVLGGMGNLKGAVIGSLIVGLAESYTTYITTTYKDMAVFIIMLLVLFIKPSGLFGEKIGDKA